MESTGEKSTGQKWGNYSLKFAALRSAILTNQQTMLPAWATTSITNLPNRKKTNETISYRYK